MSTFETVVRDQVAVNQRIEHALQRMRQKLCDDGSVVDFDVRVEHDLVANPARLALSVHEMHGDGLRMDFRAVMTSADAIRVLANSQLASGLKSELLEVAGLWRSTTSPIEVM